MTFFQKNIEFLYLFIVAMQIVILTHYIIEFIAIPTIDYFYFESVTIYFNGNKRKELLEYILGVVFIGLFFIGILLGDRKLNIKIKRYALCTLRAHSKFKNKKSFLIALSILIVLPILIYRSGGSLEGKLIIQTVGLIISIILPFWDYLLRYHYSKIEYLKKNVLKLSYYINVLFTKKMNPLNKVIQVALY